MVRTLVTCLVVAGLISGCGREPAPAPATPPSTGTGAVPAPATPAAPTSPSVANDIASDGFPTGRSSAEGVACDLARAFIECDISKFKSACYESSDNKDYVGFQQEIAAQMEQMKALPEEQRPNGPTKITQVYRSRCLSRNGPASAGYAMYGLHDVRFVDVIAAERAGNTFLCRTLVFKLADGTWRVMPRPDLYPLLSEGLDAEPDSTVAWSK